MAVQMWLGENQVDHNLTQFKPGCNVLYFSLEMPFKACFNRFLSRTGRIPQRAIRDAKLQSDDVLRLKNTLKFIENYPNTFEIVDIARGVTIEMIEAIYEESCLQGRKPDVIVIDYIGLMDYKGADNTDDWLKLGKIAEKVHEFCRAKNTIVLSAVQLNRKKGKDLEDRIGLDRVGRSAMIMHNANIALQIHTRPNEKNYSDMEIYFIKNREGELGKFNLIKDLSNCTLEDIPVELDTEFEDGLTNQLIEFQEV